MTKSKITPEDKQNCILIYKTDDKISVDVVIQDETVWLNQEQISLLFGKARSTITEHIKHIFDVGELDEKLVCRDFRHTTKHGAISDKTQTTKTKYYNLDMTMADWIQRLDVILQLNKKNILTHAGKISHELAVAKAEIEYDKFKDNLKIVEKKESLQELENDLKKIN